MIVFDGVTYYGEIYCRTNRLNKKVYIGQTTREDDLRWNECLAESRQGQGFALGAAIRKYGKDSFDRSVVFRVKLQNDLDKCQLELDRMETFFIVLYQSFLQENGYNLQMGGNGSARIQRKRGYKHSAEACAKKSRSMLGKNVGKKRTEEHKRAARERSLSNGTGKWNLGKHSKKKRASLRVCFCCYKSFDANEGGHGQLDRAFCSKSCATKVHNIFMWQDKRSA